MKTLTKWQYIEQRPNSWRKQLDLKGRKLLAQTVWSDMLVNGDTPEEAIHYCETHRELLQQEAEEERRYLEEGGVLLEPQITHG